MNEKTKELIRGAVARGWCSPENSHKELDVVLAEAISQEVEKLLNDVVAYCIAEIESHNRDPAAGLALNEICKNIQNYFETDRREMKSGGWFPSDWEYTPR